MLEKVSPGRRENVDNNARFKCQHAMLHIRRSEKTITSFEDSLLAPDRHLEQTALNNRALRMQVAVQSTDRTPFKSYLYEHNLVVIPPNRTTHAAAEFFPPGSVFEEKEWLAHEFSKEGFEEKGEKKGGKRKG